MKSTRRTDVSDPSHSSDSLSLSSLRIDPAVVPHEERTLSGHRERYIVSRSYRTAGWRAGVMIGRSRCGRYWEGVVR